MYGKKRVLFAAFAVGGLAFAGSALAQGVDVMLGVGIPFAPGQQGTSPGQVYNAARATDPTALSPGKLYIQNSATDPITAVTPGAVTPGQTFTNYGRSKK